MQKSYQAARGMNDILPSNISTWQHIEQVIRDLMQCYGYQEIRVPLVEATELFSRGIGTGTDIIEKEMYTFNDRSGDSLSLRPEMTAGITRACIEKGLLYNQTQRLWSIGSCYRYERPQKGRYRELHQLSVETYGLLGPEIDLELILICNRLWKKLGLTSHITLEINSIGDQASRQIYRQKLTDYLAPYEKELDSDSQRRLYTNPIKVFDTKDEKTRKILENAPKLHQYLSSQAKAYFDWLCSALDDLKIQYQINHQLVRGLDYYSDSVFEWTTQSLGAQGSVCGGGRYDGLISLLGGKPTTAMGFAIGLERLVLMVESLAPVGERLKYPDIIVIASEKEAIKLSLLTIETIRNHLPELNIQMSDGGGIKGQMKRAHQSGAKIACIFNELSLESNEIEVKNLSCHDRKNEKVAINDLSAYLKNNVLKK